MPKPAPFHFINWGKNLSFSNQQYYQPETEEEIIHLVKTHSKIRMLGSGHSWSALCQTEGILINLDKYNQVLEVNQENGLVRVQAGIKMKELNHILAQYGLALENQGSIDQQAVAGAISTGTHGTGINFQILGAQLVELTFIKANGEKQVVTKAQETDLYHAVVVNLGALGIITEVVLQAVPLFNLRDYTTIADFKEVINQIDFFLKNADHFKMWWLPPSKKVVIYNYQRTDEKINDSRLRRYLKDEVFSVAVYRTLAYGGKLFPKLVKPFNRFLTSQMKGPLKRIEECSKVFIVPEPPIHLETEWAFDAHKADEILTAYQKLICEKDFSLSFIQEIRFTKGDDFWLSGCQGRDTMWIGLYAYAHENWDNSLQLFEEFAIQHDGRPHWGKLFNVKRDYLEAQYPKYQDFIDLKKSWDPEGKFSNGFIEELFD